MKTAYVAPAILETFEATDVMGVADGLLGCGSETREVR